MLYYSELNFELVVSIFLFFFNFEIRIVRSYTAKPGEPVVTSGKQVFVDKE